MNDRRPFLLLDPPSTTDFCRRSALREKDTAQAAAFPCIDLILLSGAVREAGYRPIYIDAQLDRLSWSDLTDKLRALDLAGIVSLTSSSRIDEELAQLQRVKETLGNIKCFIVGTIIVQLERQRVERIMAENPWLDGIVLNTAEHNLQALIAPGGEAVEPFNVAVQRPALAGAAAGCESAPSLVGLTVKGESTAVVPAVQVRYGNALRIPQPEHAIFKDARYSFPQSKRGPVTCVQWGFGCPFTCEFCIDNQQYRKMLYRDVDDFVEELVEIDRLGFREVYIKDLTFGLNFKLAQELLTKLIERRLRLRWLCTTRVDVARPELLKLMKQAGCYGIEFGVEHAKEDVRQRVDKRITEQRIRTVFANCRKLGIETTAFIMLAFEDDTEKDVRDTIRFARSLDPDYASFNVVNALPGTAYEERARREGFLRNQANDYSFATSNIRHRHLTPEKVAELHALAVRSFYFRPRMILRKLLRLRSLYELQKIVRLARSAFSLAPRRVSSARESDPAIDCASPGVSAAASGTAN